MGWTKQKPSVHSMMEGRKKRSESERRSGLAPLQLPPVFDLPDIRRNKELSRLRADLEERERARASQDQRKTRRGRAVEGFYVDATRNVGVALGEKNVGANMKKDKR